MSTVYHAICEAPFRLFWALRLQQVVRFAPKRIRRLIYAPIVYRQRKYARLVPAEQLTATFRAALDYLLQHTRPEELGDYLEFGVYDGTSMSCLYRAVSEAGLLHRVRMFGFDSFAGLPVSGASDDGGYWNAGAFRCDYQLTRQMLDAAGVDTDRVTLVRGYFEHTLTDSLKAAHDMRRASIVMVDCDMYSSAKAALDFCGPLLSDLTVVFFDDWYPLANSNLGEKRALDEFLEDHPEFFVRHELPAYCENARVLVLARRNAVPAGTVMAQESVLG
jgi:O-methyltransferase